jgi:chromosomal replication initiator protein
VLCQFCLDLAFSTVSAADSSADPAVFCVALERSVAAARHLPQLQDGWLVDTYYAGPNMAGLRYLYDPANLPYLGDISPIVLYGPKSTGKTSLSISLALRWSRILKERPLYFSTGNTLCKDFAAAIEIDDLASFRTRLRTSKMLLIDDLDPILAKSSLQSELLTTLDHLAASGRPVIVTSSILPAGAKSIVPHLSSRLSGGLSLPLSVPDLPATFSLIEALVTKIDPLLSLDEILSLLSSFSDFKLSAPDLASLVKICHLHRSEDGSIDRTLVISLMLQRLADRTPSLPAIAKCVARCHRVRLVDLRSGSRLAHVVRARGLAILLARRLTPLSLLQIGAYFGGRDHSTILHSYHKTSALLETDTQLACLYRDCLAALLQPSPPV